MKLGHPADCSSKKKKKRETVQAKKKGITKIKKQEVSQTLNQSKNDCLFRIYHQYLNHYWNIRTKIQQGLTYDQLSLGLENITKNGWVQVKFEPLSFVS